MALSGKILSTAGFLAKEGTLIVDASFTQGSKLTELQSGLNEAKDSSQSLSIHLDSTGLNQFAHGSLLSLSTCPRSIVACLLPRDTKPACFVCSHIVVTAVTPATGFLYSAPPPRISSFFTLRRADGYVFTCGYVEILCGSVAPAAGGIQLLGCLRPH